jgi:methylenetetrahydrofolate--tRNA-(uracil-5-)-methyltransferase
LTDVRRSSLSRPADPEAGVGSAGFDKLNQPRIRVIGGGLAGSEAALTLARLGHEVDLYEMRPVRNTPAHSTANLAELVCSNSFKGLGASSAHGLLKEELLTYGSSLLPLAFQARIPAGESLAIDREDFSARVQAAIDANPAITLHREEVVAIDPDVWTIVAAGPLCSDALADAVGALVGASRLAFFDAIAPIVSADSLDFEHCWKANRWDKGDGADFINCSMDKETYHAFVAGLVEADAVEPKPFEPKELFEGCLPIEEMARRGPETLCHGPMRPVGLDDPRTGRWPHAVLQLRSENAEGTLYNLVGCQTRLKWGEQKRLFGMIPALAKAEFIRLGSMHRNSFVDSPRVLSRDFSLKVAPKVFLAGQITGAEGYTEALTTGHYAARMLHAKMGGSPLEWPSETALGSLVRFLTTPRPDDAPVFQPMNFNFGLLPNPFDEPVSALVEAVEVLVAPDQAPGASAPPPKPKKPKKIDKGFKKELQISRAMDAARGLALAS